MAKTKKNTQTTASSITLDDLAVMVKQGFDEVQNQFVKIDERFKKIESQMVTKDYLDGKLFNLKGDIMQVIRKEKKTIFTLVDMLEKKKVLSKKDVQKLEKLQSFAK